MRIVKKLLSLLVLLPTFSFAGPKDDIDPLQSLTPVTTFTINTPVSFMGQDNQLWDAIVSGLNSVPKYENTVLKILVTGFGGELYEVVRVGDALERAKANGLIVDMEVVGPAISGHAFLLCYASGSVKVQPGSSIVFHNAGDFESYFYGLIQFRSISHDITASALTEQMFNKCLAKGILTKEQVNAIKQGYKVTIFNPGNGQLLAFIDADYLTSFNEIVPQIAYVVFLLAGLLILIGLAKRI